jgi:Mrp family chromosome partitioning ATPase
LLEPQNSASSVKRVIGVVSGKGGVGKSLVTSMMAVTMQRRGYKTAILDADITGPSIPRAFGLKSGEVRGSELGMFPAITKTGIEVMSVNLLMDEETKPVVWRGPVIAGTVKQFWNGVVWNDVDYMFVDMPPGTGDVPLTVFQSLPLDGIIIVTSPQDIVSMIVEKAVNMATLMDVKILGLVENYSYIVCSDCGKVIRPYGDSKIDSLAEKYGTDVLASLPIDPELASLCDKGVIELFEGDYLERAGDIIESKTKS